MRRAAVSFLMAMAFAIIAVAARAAAPAGPNPIVIENANAGNSDWQLTRVRLDRSDGCRSALIEGYCSRQSVGAGEKIEIMVSTQPASPFRIEIFRTGYYGGLGARLMKTLGPFQGGVQPTPKPDARTMHECQWKAATEIFIPPDWPSGVYVGRLTTIPAKPEEPYWQSYVIFIVRDQRRADILFQCSDNTWQAYNGWPFKSSLYTHPKGNGPWMDVSFDRPYGREAQFAAIVNDPLTVGSGSYFAFEFPMVFWLEQHGYDVSYCSNSDMLTAERGLKCKTFLSVGHDEYWDIRQFKSAEAMRDAGASLLFFSGNSVCWISPFKTSGDGRPNRVLWRSGPYGASQPHAEDREKSNGPFPERGPDEGYLMGARNVRPVIGCGDWIAVKAEHWVFEGTGMKNGDRIPGLVGWEFHGDPPAIPGLEVVAEGTAWTSSTKAQHWTATIYPGPKENIIFSASTIFWAQGLSMPPGHMLPWSHWSRPHGPDARVQGITANLLRRTGSSRSGSDLGK